MKKLILTVGILLGVSQAHAAAVPQYVAQVAMSSATTTIVTVSNASATKMDNPQLAGRIALEVQNIDSSANLWCAPSSTVTANNGRKIAAGNSWILSFNFQTTTGTPAKPVIAPFNIYCISDGGGSTNAAVTQAY
jgi:hypothetical protein